LVIKYPSLLTENYIDCIKFYKTMFDELFDNNVCLVFTNCKGHDAWFKTQRNDPLKTIQSIHDKIKLELNLKYNMTTFYLDADPEDDDYLSIKQAIKVRRQIIDLCIGFKGIKIGNIKFPKDPDWQKDDIEEIKLVERENKTLGSSLKYAEMNFKEIGEQIYEYNTRLAELQKRYNIVDERLTEYDNEKKIY